MRPPAPAKNPLLVALADALAGALGSVVAVLAFYPIDIAKTRTQALCGGSAATTQRRGSPPIFRSRTLSALVSLVRREGLMRLYEGVEAKTLQSFMGSFVYFYAYAFIKGALRRRTDGRSLRPSLNLLAAALAGAVNQAFTLPLENITTRMQTSSSSTTTMKNPGPLTTSGCRTIITTAATGEGNSGAGRNVNSGVGGQRTEDDEKSEGSGDEAVTERYCEGGGEVGEEAGRHRANSSSNSDLAPPADGIIGIHRKGSELSGGLKLRHTPPRLPSPPPPPPLDSHEHQQYPSRRRVPRQDGRRQSVWTVARELYIEEGKGVARFWRGFAPSLILTCNPAINYTAFDFLKALWLRRRVASDPMGNNGAGPDATKVGAEVSGGSVSVPRGRAVGGDFLNPVEAFFIAAAAKSLATLVTYPLIRAKVILMTSPSLSSSSLSSSSTTREACVVERKRKDDVNNDEAQQSGEQTARTGDQLLGHVVTDDRNDRSITHAGAAISPAATAPAGAAAAGPATAAGIPSLVTASSGTGPEGNMTLERIVVVMDTDGDLTATEKETRRYRGGVRQMGGVIVRIVRHDGVRGLYSGCGAQLVHTILKSALLLATKEEIARAATSAVFWGGGLGPRA